MKAWLICESCIHAEMDKAFPREQLVKECSECAGTCFAVVSKLVSQSNDMDHEVFQCLLHCRQCASECEKFQYEDDLQLCKEVCENCGDMLKDIVAFSVN